MKETNIIKQYIENEKLNIEKIINDYTPYLYTIVNNKRSNLKEEDIEEIISDVFLAVWKNQKKLDKDKRMSSYLGGITQNIYNKKIKKLKDNIDINCYENNLYQIGSLETQVENAEREKIIRQEINNMKQEDKTIFILYYYYSKSMKEISEELGIKQAKIKSRLFRIRTKLKKMLEKKGYSYDGK